jgi:hypothetical protein
MMFSSLVLTLLETNCAGWCELKNLDRFLFQSSTHLHSHSNIHTWMATTLPDGYQIFNLPIG